MRIAIPGRPFAALIFPVDDRVLARRVQETMETMRADGPEASVAELRDHLAGIYPRVAIRLREGFAGFGQPVAYVFRDGTALPEGHDLRWAEEPGVARVVTDGSGTYVEANAAAAELFGVSAADIVGRPAGTFTRPDARIRDAAALWADLQETGRLHSLALLQAPGGRTRHVEFITVRDAAGPGRTVTALRVIA